jgi:hypothetical protein
MPILVGDLVTLVLVAGIALLLGLLLGLGIASAMGFWERRRERRRGRDELLRVWREARSRRLNLEVEGDIYQTTDDLSVRQYREILRTLNELGKWLGGIRGEIRPPVFEDQSEGALEYTGSPIQQIQSTEAPQATNERQAGAAPPVNPAGTGISIPTDEAGEKTQRVENKRSSGLGSSLGRIFRRKQPEKQEQPTSMAEQIDAILQEKLSGIPLPGVEINLVESPDRGLSVLVGDQVYDGVGEIPDDRIRELIQDSVREWEKRQDESIRRY